VEPKDTSFPDHQNTNLGLPEFSQWSEGQINPARWPQGGATVSTEESLPSGEMSPRHVNITGKFIF
jgi:hypothetical protein